MTISNSEQNIVSEMATAVAKMLDSDKKNLVSTNEELSDNEGFFMWVKDGAPGLHVQLNGAGKVPHLTGSNASASQQEMWDAYRRWQDRKVIAHTLAPPIKARPLLEFAMRVLTPQMLLFVIAVGVVLAAAGSITSCAVEASKTEQALNEAVNKYGFKRVNIPIDKRWNYPADCFKEDSAGYSYAWTRSLSTCRSSLEAWEREGTVWVTWKDAQ